MPPGWRRSFGGIYLRRMSTKLLPFLFVLSFTINAFSNVDLALTLSDSPDPATLGSTLTYAINILNGGPEAASNVVMGLAMPNSVVFQAIQSPDEWPCTVPEVGATGTITCAKVHVEPTEASTIMVMVKLGASGIVASTATVTATEGELNPENNTDTEETMVAPVTQPSSSLPPALLLSLSGLQKSGDVKWVSNGRNWKCRNKQSTDWTPSDSSATSAALFLRSALRVPSTDQSDRRFVGG